MPGHVFQYGCLNDLAEIAKPEDTVSFTLRCTRCGTLSPASAPIVAVHPAASSIHPDWDGIVLPFIVPCAACSAEDEYELEPAALANLRERAAAARSRGSVVQAELRTWDGAVPRRPIESIRHLEEIARRDSSCGEAWRRYGNALEKLGRVDEAVTAWERAVAIDENEFDAAVCLAERAHRSEADDVWERIACALGRCKANRWPSAAEAHAAAGRKIGNHYARESLQERRKLIKLLLDVLEVRSAEEHIGLGVAWSVDPAAGGCGSTRDSPNVTITLSGVDLSELSRWDRLAEFLASDLVIGAHLAKPPESRPTFLEAFLESGAPLGALDLLPREMPPGTKLVRYSPEPSTVWRSSSKKRNRRSRTAHAR